MPEKRPLPCSHPPHILDDMEKTISMSQLAKNVERIAQDIQKSGTVYRIRHPGRPNMMLVDEDYLERWRATYDFMARHPNWEQELEDAHQEELDGKLIPLEDVLRQLGLDIRRAKAEAQVEISAIRRASARSTAGGRRAKSRRRAVRPSSSSAKR